VLPGALTNDPFHTGRMIAYPVFLLVLTVPALSWLIDQSGESAGTRSLKRNPGWWLGLSGKRVALIVLLAGTIGQAIFFQMRFWRDGYDRPYAWDLTYKEVYDQAVAQPSRPIYLEDGKWGPGYIHALWYATLEGRNTSEFVHLPYRGQPPAGAIVISSAAACRRCEVILDTGQYSLYRSY
jgi:hypothetical protein